MDDHGPHADRAHQGHVLCERREVAGHGRAAVLDHNDLAPEPPDVGKGLGQHPGLLRCVHRGHDVLMFSSMYAWVRSLVRTVASDVPSPRSAVTST